VKNTGFTHLHVHSCYSIGESVLKIEDLVSGCKKLGYHSVALTDRDNLYGAIKFYFYALEHGVKPIIGCELGFEEGYLVLLVKDEKGFSNLISLVSKKNSGDEIKYDDLFKNKEGLIVLSGFEDSKVLSLIKDDRLEELERHLSYMKENLEDDFYVEINCNASSKIRAFMHILEGISEYLKINTVLTNNVKYLISPHYKLLDAYRCVIRGEKYYDEEREKVENDQEFLKSADVMSEAGFENAYKTAREIDWKCNLMLRKKDLVPDYNLPDGFESSSEYIRYLTSKNIEKLYSEKDREKATERLNYELGVIKKLQYCDYFLLVWDIIRFAREKNITVGGGRGSAVSSIVAYLLEITEIDPLEHDLIFERFLNPGREELPDIDIDVSSEKREKLLSYIRQRFGKDKVASIISFGTFKSALAIREIGKTLEIPDVTIEQILASLNRSRTIADNMKKNPEFKRLSDKSGDVRKVLIGAQKLEGIVRNTSLHAAGLIIYPQRLQGNIPYNSDESKLISQWDKDSIENLGILKIDVLSLRTLSTIDNILKNIRKKDLKIDYDDPEVYEMISKGRTAGIFQLETSNMTRHAILLKPVKFSELCALTALVRPGARDNFELFLKNRASGDYRWKKIKPLKKILDSTYGVIIYQEQVMEIAKDIAGFSLSEADNFRKAMTKKDIYIMKEMEERFLSGANKNHFEEEMAKELFKDISRFAGYGFNKAHAVAYCALSYKCAFLKKRFPNEFYTEILNQDIDRIEKTEKIVREMREQGVNVLAPDLLRSKSRFSKTQKGIRFSFSGIKGIGTTNAKILESFVKGTNKKIESWDEFLFKAKGAGISEKIIKALVFSGALDRFNCSRKYMIDNMGASLDYNSLFSEQVEEDKTGEFDDAYLREKEKEYTGLIFSRDVIDDFSITIRLLSEESLGEASRITTRILWLCGIIREFEEEEFSEQILKRMTIEDYSSDLKILVEPELINGLKKEEVVCVKVEYSDYGYRLLDIRTIREAFADERLKLIIHIDEVQVIENLRDIFDIHPGNHQVIIIAEAGNKDIKVESEHNVEISEIILEEIEELIGIENMQLRFVEDD